MCTSQQPDEQPLNSQCESSSPQSQPPVALDSTCKVSPFKPNSSRKRKLPFPSLTPIPIRFEGHHTRDSLPSPKLRQSAAEPANSRCVSNIPVSGTPLANCTTSQVGDRSKLKKPRSSSDDQSLSRSLPRIDERAPVVPLDIDVPSPPALSSSDESAAENDTIDSCQCLVKTVKQDEALEAQVLRPPLPKTDTCDPPEFSQDSAFFSFSNAPGEAPNDQIDAIPPSHEHGTTVQAQTRKRYYTRAFDYVIAEVLKRYHSILPSQDVDTARILRDNLSENAQALFVRLYGRKQPHWYRASKLEQAYESEIDVSAGINELCVEGFLISSVFVLKGSPKAVSLLARELLSVLELSELRTACGCVVDGAALRRFPRIRLLPELRKLLSRTDSARRSKKKLMQTTLSGLKPSECLARAVLKLAGHSVRIPDSILSALKRMRSLFFLDDGHDSPNVILADTGKAKFPEYKCEPKRAIFPSAQALKDYESALELEQCVDEFLEDKDWSQAAYFGSIAELEVREFFNKCEVQEQGRLHSPVNSIERVMSSRQPRKRKHINWKEQLEQLSHPFLRRYTAQWVFVRSCWHSVQALERLSEYESAVSRLKLLLSTDLMPRRRGKCLTRLTINLFKHLGGLEEPLQIIVSALSSTESHLHLGDQIGLAQRGAAIHAKLVAKSVPERSRDHKIGETGSDTQSSARPRVIVEALERGATEVSVRKIYGKSLNVRSKEEKDRISNIEDPWLRYIEENRSEVQQDKLRANLSIMGKSVFMSQRGNGARVSVEEYCLEWYSTKENLTGAHDEGKALRFLFTLLLWECALFAEVADVFQTPYQDRPLDLCTEAFYPSRKERIDLRLVEIAGMSCDEMYEETQNRYQEFEGTRAVGCAWTSYSSEDIATVAAGLGGQALAHCCSLLAKDYMYWGGGMPDLTMWKVNDDGRGKEYKTKLVEVKSARDTLSERQRAWLMELDSCGVECEVCKVVEKVTKRNASELQETSIKELVTNDKG